MAQPKMIRTVNDFVMQEFPIACKGRDADMNECLDTAVDASVEIRKSAGSSTLTSTVNCPYNTGSHGQRCMASHPGYEKVGAGVNCPYALDIPYAAEFFHKMMREKR